LEAAEAALVLEPVYESAVGMHIQAEQRRGNNAAALRAFGKHESKLKMDLGLVPPEATQRLVADSPFRRSTKLMGDN
jgi:DNA-binding SARP family transcriptional activator